MGCHSLPRLEDFVPKSRRCRRSWICEQVRVFALALVFTFPRVFWTSVCIPTDFNDSSGNDYKLHLSMHGEATQLEKQMGAKLAWLREKYSYCTREGIGCSSSQANCYLTAKELHQLRMDEEALREMLKEEVMNKKVQEEITTISGKTKQKMTKLF
ncbi:hypothetical protein Tco_0768405 [Tanacetum coccineum]